MKNIEKQINSIPRFHKKPGLPRIKGFIKKNISKLDKYTIIIGGTNGKGSVGVLLEKVLYKANIKPGSMRSPHIYHITERINYKGKNIPTDIFKDIFEFTIKHFKKQKESPTMADVLTACSILYFYKYVKTDILLMEVGMGGMLDPVNILNRNISVITNIGHDHCNILGQYPQEITIKKAGIIKEKIPIITAEKNKIVINILNEICNKKKSPLIKVAEPIIKSINYNGTQFLYKGNNYINGIPGSRQGENGALAIEAIKLLKKDFEIPESAIFSGFKESRLPWRMEINSLKPTIIFDGAHNKESFKNLKDTLKFFVYKDLHIILFLQKSKILEDFPLKFPGNNINLYLPKIKNKKFYNPKVLQETLKTFNGQVINSLNLEDSIKSAIKNAKENDLILFTGSFKIANKIKMQLKQFKAI